MNANLLNSAQTPHILVLGMGGTIAGLAVNPEIKPLDYQSGQLGVENLLRHIAQAVPEGLTLLSKQITNLDSRNLAESHLVLLGRAVHEALANPMVLGIVVTHGTDTMEETGAFLQFTCGKHAQNLGKRVILTGAILPANALGADGPSNLLDAIRWAASPIDNCPGGIFAVMAGRACMALDLSKRHTTALNALVKDSPSSSTGLINPSWLSGVKAVEAAWLEDLPIPDEGDWPWVEILTSHTGARPETIRHWMGSEVDGLVLAGTGMGGLHKAWEESLGLAATQGIALVRTSRAGSGEIAVEGSILAAGHLSAPRARIALQLALNAAKQAKIIGKPLTWQDFFARIADLPKIQ